MVEVKHIRRENKNREIHEMIDLENTKQMYFTDKILISKEGGSTFLLEQKDFEDLYKRKEREFKKYLKTN